MVINTGSQKEVVMRRYKIGEVSKILNMPVESIRFFEQKGVLAPHKDQSNNYRYYTIWEINRLLDYRKYRELGFSLNEALEIIKNSDFKNFEERLRMKQAEAEAEANYYEMKAIKLRNYLNVLRKISLLTDTYTVVVRPACYYFINQYYNGDSFEFLRAEDTDGDFDEMLKHYTFVENLYRVKQEWFQGAQDVEQFQWGMTIKEKWADAIGLRLSPKMSYAPPVKALYTFIQTRNKIPFSPRLLEPAMEYMKENGYQLSGDVLGVLVATTQENGEEIRYMEVWIPIKE